MSSHTSMCIKETGNWGKLDKQHKFDHPEFTPAKVLDDMQDASPKIQLLIDKIKELDAADMKMCGHTFKHFIYSDIRSSYGAKLIASALNAGGFEHAYGLTKGARGMGFQLTKGLEKKKDRFATLTSVLFFGKPIGVNFRRELLRKFNSRPDNIYGEQIRIIVLDSGFREGVDLFDVKYVHIVEPIATLADQKQAIGRATRFCGQKGLAFSSKKGWPLHVFRYETTIPKVIKRVLLAQNQSLAPAETIFDLFMRFSNIDPAKITLSNELEKMTIYGSVDRLLTRNVHNFAGIDQEEPDEYFQQIFLQEGGGREGRELTRFQKSQAEIKGHYLKYAWPKTKIENGCLPPPSSAAQKSAASHGTIVSFTPTQEFIRHYFTPKASQKGMLLYHSVGTGKTCTAIATASSSFEKEGYTIIYVTRHTLKADVWKNMFDQVCSAVIQDIIANEGPQGQAAMMKRISKSWMSPMSYKQFSNMILGKNALYNELVSRNGKEDPLRKTLIIIDEAHKLYAPDVSGSEKPDVGAIRKMIESSYDRSGKDSARVLLMTATPYTEDPIDLMRLLNFFKTRGKEMPETFALFKEQYLNEEGKFTDAGRGKYLDDIAGLVSYLNREKDVRTFAYPIIKNIHVPMSDYTYHDLLDKYTTKLAMSNKLVDDIDSTIKANKRDQIARRHELANEFEKKPEYKKLQKEHERCLAHYQKHHEKNMAGYKKEHGTLVAKCEVLVKQCQESMKHAYNEEVARLKSESRTQMKDCPGKGAEKDACKARIKKQLAKSLFKIKEERLFDTGQCRDAGSPYKACVGEADRVYEGRVLEEKQKKEGCNEMDASLKQMKKDNEQYIQQTLEKENQIAQRKIEFDKNLLKVTQKEVQQLQTSIQEKAKSDVSQRSALEKCLSKEKIKPYYKYVLKGKHHVFIEADDDESHKEDPDPEQGSKSRVFIVHGHGSEDIKHFNQRMTLPEDKILVVFPVCGRYNWMNISCDFQAMFDDPKYSKWMMNPVRYKSLIEKTLGAPIRIYLPGDKVPFMSTSLFYDFNIGNKTVLMKSGVFRMQAMPDVDRNALPEITESRMNLGSDKCRKYIGTVARPEDYTSTVHREVFKGNLFKPAAAKQSFHQMKYRSFNVHDVIDAVGPGIFYYTGCRSTEKDIPENVYRHVLDRSLSQQDRKDKSQKYKKFAEEVKLTSNSMVVEDSIHSPSKTNSTLKNESSKSPKSLSPPPSPSLSKENSAVREKKRLLKDQNRLVRKIGEVERKVNVRITEILSENADATNAKRQTILQESSGLLAELQKVTEGQELAVAVLKKRDYCLETLQILEDLVTNDSAIQQIKQQGKHVLKTKSAKKFTTFFESRQYTIKKRRFRIDDIVIGIIPDNKDMENKCDSSSIVRRVKNIYQYNRKALDTLGLPLSIDKWTSMNPEEADALFSELCKQTLRLASDV